MYILCISGKWKVNFDDDILCVCDFCWYCFYWHELVWNKMTSFLKKIHKFYWIHRFKKTNTLKKNQHHKYTLRDIFKEHVWILSTINYKTSVMITDTKKRVVKNNGFLLFSIKCVYLFLTRVLLNIRIDIALSNVTFFIINL